MTTNTASLLCELQCAPLLAVCAHVVQLGGWGAAYGRGCAAAAAAAAVAAPIPAALAQRQPPLYRAWLPSPLVSKLSPPFKACGGGCSVSSSEPCTGIPLLTAPCSSPLPPLTGPPTVQSHDWAVRLPGRPHCRHGPAGPPQVPVSRLLSYLGLGGMHASAMRHAQHAHEAAAAVGATPACAVAYEFRLSKILPAPPQDAG